MDPSATTMEVYKGSLCARWPVLALSSLMMIGSYYCYDNPSALQDYMEEYFANDVHKDARIHTKDEFVKQFAWLYTVYSIPNTVLPFLGGFFVDKMSARLMNIVFCGCILVGQFIFAVGVFAGSFPIMIAGRVVFGLGGESLCVGQSALVQQWFCESLNDHPADGGGSIQAGKSKERQCAQRFGLGLAFAMGLNLSLARLGSVLNNVASPALASYFAKHHEASDTTGSLAAADGLFDDSAAPTSGAGPGVPYAIGFGVLVCCGSMASAIATYCLDKSYEDRAIRERLVVDTAQDLSIRMEDQTKESTTSTCAEIAKVLNFGAAFWLLAVSCVTVYACVLPWNNIAQDFLLEKYLCPGTCEPEPCCSTVQVSACPAPGCVPATGQPGVFNPTKNDAIKTVSFAMSIPYVISAVASPFLGAAVDMFGHRVILTTMSAMALVAVHLTFSLAPEGLAHPAFMYIPLVGQGVAYSIYAAALWPSVQATVGQNDVGTAYGVVTAVQNGGLALFPVIVGGLRAHFHHYAPWVEVFFSAQAGVGVLAGFVLYCVDRTQLGGRLERAGDGAQEPEGDANQPLLT